jgi:hypothetical protein
LTVFNYFSAKIKSGENCWSCSGENHSRHCSQREYVNLSPNPEYAISVLQSSGRILTAFGMSPYRAYKCLVTTHARPIQSYRPFVFVTRALGFPSCRDMLWFNELDVFPAVSFLNILNTLYKSTCYIGYCIKRIQILLYTIGSKAPKHYRMNDYVKEFELCYRLGYRAPIHYRMNDQSHSSKEINCVGVMNYNVFGLTIRS